MFALEAEIKRLEKELSAVGATRIHITAQVKEATQEAAAEAEHLQKGLSKWEAIDSATGRSKENMIAREIQKHGDEVASMNTKVAALTRKHEVESNRLTTKAKDKVGFCGNAEGVGVGVGVPNEGRGNRPVMLCNCRARTYTHIYTYTHTRARA